MQKYAHVLKIALLLLSILSLLLLCSCDVSENEGSESQSETETVLDCAHEDTYWDTETAATCTEGGLIKKICRTCEATVDTEQTARLPHREVIVKGTAATCTETGLSDGKKCELCSAVLVEQVVIAKKAHTEITLAGKAPTCTEKGYRDGVKCSECSTVLVAQTEIAPLSHEESDWIIDQKAEVGVAGSKHTECTRCSTTLKTDVIPAIDDLHTHAGDAWSVTTPATCKEEGVESRLCSCGEVLETRPTTKLPHTEKVLPAKAATCKDTGLTEGKVCDVCGEIILEQRKISTTDHTPRVVLGYAATCTEAGLTDGSACEICPTILSSQVVIPPKGHTFSSGACLGCGIPTPISVWIVDGLGNPVSDVYVKVMKGDEQVKMVAYDGEFLELNGLDENETYTLSLNLSSLGEGYVYDEADAVIIPDKPCASIRVYRELKQSSSVYVGGSVDKDYNVYDITGEGSYRLALTPNDYTYFVFTPPAAAIYTLTYVADATLAIEYRGASFYVWDHDMAPESTDTFSDYENGLATRVYSSDLGGDRVFAIKSEGATTCILNIKNAGDPGKRLEDEPWTPYLEDEDVVAAQLAEKPTGTYTAFNLSDLTPLQ